MSISRLVFIHRMLPFGRPNSFTFKTNTRFYDHKGIKWRLVSEYLEFSLKEWFLALTTHWNYLGSLKKYWYLGLTPRDSHGNWSGVWPEFGEFLKDSDVQPVLKMQSLCLSPCRMVVKERENSLLTLGIVQSLTRPLLCEGNSRRGGTACTV